MPGPVSDSYHPEFGTCQNARDVEEAIEGLLDGIKAFIGEELRNITEVIQEGPFGEAKFALSKNQLRLIRFGLNKTLEYLREDREENTLLVSLEKVTSFREEDEKIFKDYGITFEYREVHFNSLLEILRKIKNPVCLSFTDKGVKVQHPHDF